MKHLSIRLKLILSLGGLACGYILFLGLVEWTGSQMRHHLVLASDSLFPAALASQKADAGFQKLVQDYKDAVLTQNQAMLSAADEDAKAVTSYLQAVREKTPGNGAIQQQVALIQDQFKDISSKSKATYSQMLASPDAMDEQLMSAVKNLAAANDGMVKSLKDLNENISKREFQSELNRVGDATGLQLRLTAILFCVAVGFAILTIVVLQRQVAVPLGRAVEMLGEVAAGDLTATLEVDSRDEVGRMAQALNETLGKIRTTLEEVADGAHNATSSSLEVAAASEAISSGAQEQAASLEETSASLEQITATVRNTAENANQASELAAASNASAVQGQEVVSKAITAMSDINVASAKISEIISTIDEIAFQTNLLAVNAAVEAARAGEEGRGFAVVAAEVRSLAQRSASAAKEIKGLIQDSLNKVKVGSELVNRSGETLQGIVSSVKRVSGIVGEIAIAAGEQSSGIEQVNAAMTQMDGVTQSNSAQTEELSATASALAGQAQHLLLLIDRFKLQSTANQSGVNLAMATRQSPAMHALEQAEPALPHRPQATPAKSTHFVRTTPAPSRKRKALVRTAPAVPVASTASAAEGSFEEF